MNGKRKRSEESRKDKGMTKEMVVKTRKVKDGGNEGKWKPRGNREEKTLKREGSGNRYGERKRERKVNRM